ncbi:MAG: YceD family protein [Pyrinomonadaceae bacterium]
MIVELGSLDREPHPFQLSVPAGDLDLELENVRIDGKVEAKGEIVRHAVQTDVRGTITAPIEVDCVRCLGPVERTLDVSFHVSYVSPEHFAADKEKEVTADDLETDILVDDRLDLKDLVREQILLDIPLQVFCSENCKGLCAKCGGNLNLLDCKCTEGDIDPRWAALRDAGNRN